MDDRVDSAGERGLERVEIGDVPDDDVDLGVGVRLQVDDADVRAGVRQLGHRVAADEPRATGHEDPAPV